MRLKDTGIRKIHFKDYCQEPPGAAVDGMLWAAQAPAQWSIGLGAGALPSTFQGQGYRHLVTAGVAPSRKYTITPGANDWWDTIQTTSKGRYTLTFDFGLRIINFAADGITFGWLVEHGGGPGFVESKGYRVRFTATDMIIEKLNIPGGVMTWTILYSEPLPLGLAKDYYVRINYIPEDFSLYGHDVDLAGTIKVSVTDQFDKRGQDDIYSLFYVDPAPMTGSASSRLSMSAQSIPGQAEFWGIIYSEPFLGKPDFLRYYGSAKRFRQDLEIQYVQQTQEEFDLLTPGDRIELWLSERYASKTGGVITKYRKTVCRFDGMIYKIDQDDVNKKARIFAKDEFDIMILGQLGYIDITSGGDYYDYLYSILAEYQGERPFPQRICSIPGIYDGSWNTAVSDDYTWRGKAHNFIRTITLVTQNWFYWDPATAILISQRAPIATGRKIDLENAPGEEVRVIASVAINNRRDQWFSKVTGYHDDGSGSVTTTEDESASDQQDYGSSEESLIEVDLPLTEGGLMTDNHYAQYSNKNKIIDIVAIAWGAEFGIGCQLEVIDPSKNIDSEYYTVIEVEILASNANKGKGLPPAVMRLRLSRQDEDEGDYPVLPRYEEPREQLRVDKRKDTESTLHNFT